MSDELLIYITLALLAGGITALYHITVKPLFQLIRKWMKRSDGKRESDNNTMNKEDNQTRDLLVKTLEDIDNTINEEDNQTRNLLIKTLEDIGCQHEICNDESIVFMYQGEEFKIDASNDSYIIWIYNIAWTGIEANDTDADFLKQAINKVNENSAVTNLYITNKENGFIVAHCQIATYFASNIPDYREYLKSILNSFFFCHQQVRDEFNNLLKNQEKKERIEIKGFK